mmetsp:Transcript_69575/g.166885  ORF Transcript_69575/g.166885 Transcript_69575/m.166885 type:complete len:618 (+) Transcript_69575:108-1961(+)
MESERPTEVGSGMPLPACPSACFLSGLGEEDGEKNQAVQAAWQPREEWASAVKDAAPAKDMSRISTEATMPTSGESASSEAGADVAPTWTYEAQNLDVPVVIVTSEIHPWSKSGGLAIVASAYAYNFAVRGHRTMAIAPMYDDYEGAFYQCSKSFELFGAWHEVRYFHHFQTYGNGVGADYVFIDHPSFRRPGGLYNDANGEYQDNLFRFALFSLAALEVPVGIDLGGSPRYGGRCLFIANDWQTGMVPVYMQHRHRACGNYHHARCIFVIHNLGYQGCYPLRLGIPPIQFDNFAQLGLPFAALGDLLYQYPAWERTYEGDTGETLNITKAAIGTCDRVLTVSPGYANEIRTPEGGFRLNDVLAGKSFFLAGILNGIDGSWNPRTDTHIAANFSAADLSGKEACKLELQRNLGLKEDPEACLFVFVGRLTAQKGVDLLGEIMHWLMEDPKDGMNKTQIIMMGNGEKEYGNMFMWAETQWKGRICGYYGFNPLVERAMLAGGDYLLMPSRYEPCGIPQMCAMAYGTLPIVHATGGLRDSVHSYYDDLATATGFHVMPLHGNSLKKVIFDALDVHFRKPELRDEMRRRAMSEDFSWPRAIDEYERHIDFTLADPPLYGR